MTNDQIELVQNSFTQVAPIAETAAGMFYGLLRVARDAERAFRMNSFGPRRCLFSPSVAAGREGRGVKGKS